MHNNQNSLNYYDKLNELNNRPNHSFMASMVGSTSTIAEIDSRQLVSEINNLSLATSSENSRKDPKLMRPMDFVPSHTEWRQELRKTPIYTPMSPNSHVIPPTLLGNQQLPNYNPSAHNVFSNRTFSPPPSEPFGISMTSSLQSLASSEVREGSTTPTSVYGSTLSLRQIPKYPKNKNETFFLFAALRNGENLVLIVTKKQRRFEVNEKMLKEQYQIGLGDFLKATLDGNNQLTGFWKEDLSKFPEFRFFRVKVVGDEAQIENVKGNVVKGEDGPMVFRSKHFSDALILVGNKPGTFLATLKLKKTPSPFEHNTYHYDVMKLKPFLVRYPNQKPLNHPGLINKKAFMSGESNQNQNHPIPVQNQQKVVGTGFAPPKPVIGAGFKEVKEQVKKDGIVGDGFKEISVPTQKLRAVVTAFQVKQDRTHFLWLVDKKVESVFVSKKNGVNRATGADTHEIELPMGVCFEGLFRVDKEGKFVCQEYLNPIEQLIEGGLENGYLFFEVKINNYQKKYNQMYASVHANYLGEILDINSKLTPDCNGKKVRVQKKGIADKEMQIKYVWAVVDVL